MNENLLTADYTDDADDAEGTNALPTNVEARMSNDEGMSEARMTN